MARRPRLHIVAALAASFPIAAAEEPYLHRRGPPAMAATDAAFVPENLFLGRSPRLQEDRRRR